MIRDQPVHAHDPLGEVDITSGMYTDSKRTATDRPEWLSAGWNSEVAMRMPKMRIRRSELMLRMLTFVPSAASRFLPRTYTAQAKPAGQKDYERLIYSVKGPDLFRAHCAACHGLDGKGSGPVAPTLKIKPADLTVIAKNNGGKFPEARVTQDHFRRRTFAAVARLSRDAHLGPDLSPDRGRSGFRQCAFAES